MPPPFAVIDDEEVGFWVPDMVDTEPCPVPCPNPDCPCQYKPKEDADGDSA